jgi:hypothetical protein
LIKKSPLHIAVVEFAVAQVGFGKVSLDHGAIFENTLLVFLFEEHGIVQNAVIKVHFHQEIKAAAEIQPAEFAMFKADMLQTRTAYIGQRQVAILKNTSDKQDAAQIGAGEVAVHKFAVLKLAAGENGIVRFDPRKYFIFLYFGGHRAK